MANADWSTDALKALKLRLVRSKAQIGALDADEIALVDDFEPTFVYPIFGQEEIIFGYKGLQIELQFTSGSLKQYLSVTHTATFPASSTVKPDDPEKLLYEFIPSDYTKSLDAFHETVEADAGFTPLGERIAAYRFKSEDDEDKPPPSKGKGKAKVEPKLPERDWVQIDEAAEEEVELEDDEVDVSYEIWRSDWDTEGFREFHRRMQIFVLLFIEGATYIDEEDPRWSFVTLFEKRRKGKEISYHFMGYISFYSFFFWPETKRLRLAQFVLLPIYQGQGHGSALYSLTYQNILARPEISELTLEDPSEAVEDLRDKADLYTLISSGDFKSLTAPWDKPSVEALRKKFKLADRQFYRLLEMLYLLQLDPASSSFKEDETALRLTVKRRLYAHNKDTLVQIEDERERKDKIEETYRGLINDYRRITQKFVA